MTRWSWRLARTLALAGAVALAVIVSSQCAGCSGGALDAADRGTVLAGRALHLADHEVAEQLERASVEAVAVAAQVDGTPAERLAAYDRRMAEWQELARALETARQTWLTADTALRAWSSGTDARADRRWMQAVACLVESLSHVARITDELGVRLGRDILGAVDVLEPLAAAACMEGGDGPR